MRALQMTSSDGPGALHLVDVPTPRPTTGEVLLRVTAAGVNFADTQESRGTYPPGRTPPYLAGQEVVGEVVELGPDVQGWAIGQHAYGGGPGAFAEYVVAPAAGLVPVPASWTDTQTAGLLSNWLTAYAALRTFGRLAAGETVLVHAAAGGVGQAAVRIAQALGARVLATASGPEKLALLDRLGVPDAIDYSTGNLAAAVRERTGGRGVDVVLDGVGGETFRADLALTVPHTGRIVVIGIVAGDAAVTNRELLWDHPVQLIGFNLRRLSMTRPDLFGTLVGELLRLMAEHSITPPEPTAHDLADGPKVLAEMEQRRTTGKLVLVP